jgi:hypothetical protein
MTNRKSLYARVGVLCMIVASGLWTLTTNGCNEGAEGDRCNPNLMSTSPMYNENECGGGLTCQNPPNCPETYCCPAVILPTTNINCQTGCNGGATAGCAAGVAADCVWLCQQDAGALPDCTALLDAGTD